MFVFVKIIILMSKCIAKSEVIAWQSRGHGFEPRYLHHFILLQEWLWSAILGDFFLMGWLLSGYEFDLK